jgi:hypothetical protein
MDRAMSRVIAGYAILWNALSLPLGDFRERHARSAFDRNQREHIDILALNGHQHTQPIGRLSAGTLTAVPDAKGLRVTVDVAETSWGDDLLVSRHRRDQSGWSFGFTPKGDTWEMTGDMPTRTVTDAIYHEVSPVVWPAFPQTEHAERYTVAHELGSVSREAAAGVARMLRRLSRDRAGGGHRRSGGAPTLRPDDPAAVTVRFQAPIMRRRCGRYAEELRPDDDDGARARPHRRCPQVYDPATPRRAVILRRPSGVSCDAATGAEVTPDARSPLLLRQAAFTQRRR